MDKKGFTLIELLAVVVLMAILASISIYSVSKSIKSSKEEKASIDDKSIKKACKLYALEYEKASGDKVSTDTLVEEGYLEKLDSNYWYEIKLDENKVYSCTKSS